MKLQTHLASLPATKTVASLVSAASLLAASAVYAQSTDTWSGASGTSANWSDSNNWNTLPQSGDSLVFGAVGTSGTALNDDLTNDSFTIGGITFNSGASAFVISGNDIALAAGAVISNSSSALQTINDNIILNGTSSISTGTSNGNITLNGVLSGTGSLSFESATTQSGTLTLNGTNTFSGGVTLGASANEALTQVVVVGNASALGSGTINMRGAQLQSSVANLTITNNVSVSSGGLRAGGTNNITFAGTVAIDNTSRTLANYGTGGALITINNIDLTSGSSAIASFDGGTIVVSGSIFGSGGVSATNNLSGTLSAGNATLAGNDTYTGATTVSGGLLTISGTVNGTTKVTVSSGTLSVASGGSLTTSTAAINGGGTVSVTGNLTVTGNFQTGNSSGGAVLNIGAGGIVTASSVTQSYADNMVVNGTLNSGTILTLSSGAVCSITGTGTINTAQLNYGNYVTETISVANLNIGSGGITNAVGINPGGTLSFGAATISATANWSSSAALGLVAASGTSTTFNTTGGNITLSGVLSGTGSLTAAGAGTLTLSGKNTYTGNTNVTDGAFALASTGHLAFALANGDSSNRLTIATGVTATLSGVFDITDTGVTDSSNSWQLVANSGTLNGTLSSLTLDGTAFTNQGSGVWTATDSLGTYTYTASTGVLSLIAVPEPSTVTLTIIFGAGMLMLFRRRAHRS